MELLPTDYSACISSILRAYYSIQLLNVGDFTYHSADLFWAATLEATSAILVASFPVMPRLYQTICRKKQTSSAVRSSFLSRLGQGSLYYRLLSSFSRLGKKGSISGLTDEEQRQHKPQWSPNIDPEMKVPFNTQVSDYRYAYIHSDESESKVDPESTGIRKTTDIEATYWPPHRSA